MVTWGTDALWDRLAAMAIEVCAVLEIPEDMQTKHGFKPLGAARGPVKTAIFGDNNARLYNIDQLKAGAEIAADNFSKRKRTYDKAGPDPSNLRYACAIILRQFTALLS